MNFNNDVSRMVQIIDFNYTHSYNQYHKYVKYHKEPYNQNMRKKGNLKQPGGASCNQRR